MFIRKTALTYFVLCVFVFAAIAQKQALSKIDKQDLKKYLTFISSDDLEGRKLGTEVDGLEITAKYIADNASRIGLEPGSDNYYQKVEMVSTKPDKSNFIEIQNAKGKSLYKSNSVINLVSAAAFTTIENEQIVLAGFGYYNSETGYNDVEDMDVADKVVMIAQGNPESFKQGDNFRWNNRLERSKIVAISELKPKAIIIVTNPQDEQNKTFNQINAWFNRESYSLKSSVDEEEIPVFITIPDFADKLLGGKGKYKNYLDSITKSSQPNSYIANKKTLNLKFKRATTAVNAKNVIGIVKGSDPVLKDEYVVFMAHYDHLGIAENGDVFNGADDNGSGSVAILEVAEAFASLKTKPKRSIVFLWVTCEEIGLLGSEYYVENPIFPLEKTVTCVNLDMVGRVFELRDTVWNRSPKKVKDFDGLFTLANDVWPELAQINAEKCAELELEPDTSLPSYFLRSSDHYHFHRKGVPVLNYATGYHADYHKVGDEIEKINFDKIKRVADLCFLVGYEVANVENIVIERDE
jgi:hypothetical protein